MSPASSGSSHLFTVVIASLCEEVRAGLLKRAIESVRAMARGHDLSIIVVANGPHVSQNVLDWLAAAPDVRVVRLHSGSHPLARRLGAELADTELLAFLDDDDELLPDTLARKVAYFREHPEVDVLVTDGLRVAGAARTRIFPRPEARSDDLVETMMSAGWGAGAITLRARSIDLSAFDPQLRHLEWTLTTLELARHHGVGFLDEPTFLYYPDTPNSLSKRAEHKLAAPVVWSRLSKTYAGTRYEDTVSRRYGRVCGNACLEYARRGEMREAWRLNFESLRSPGGLALLPNTARLVAASLSRLFWRPGKPQTPAAAGIYQPDRPLKPGKPAGEGQTR